MNFRLFKETERLKQNVISLVAEVENNLRLSVNALEERDVEKARNVIKNDSLVDQMEVDIEEECLKILALYQPVAHDLRYIITIIKITVDLERISDLAVNIAERAMFLSTRRQVAFSFDFHLMADRVQDMLKKSIDALVSLDAKKAYAVCSFDDKVDALNRDFYAVMKDVIRAEPDYIEEMSHFLGVSRYLERIADHATNIAEDVVYMIKGDIIRHQVEQFDLDNEES